MITTYYDRELMGETAVVVRLTWDPATNASSAYYANRGSASWVEDPSIYLEVQGAGGSADYQPVTRERALKILRKWGVAPDDLDAREKAPQESQGA